jgi:hypothetical protein
MAKKFGIATIVAVILTLALPSDSFLLVMAVGLVLALVTMLASVILESANHWLTPGPRVRGPRVGHA